MANLPSWFRPWSQRQSTYGQIELLPFNDFYPIKAQPGPKRYITPETIPACGDFPFKGTEASATSSHPAQPRSLNS
jgi:hypothetical protein